MRVRRHIHDESHDSPPRRVDAATLCARHPDVDFLVIENHPDAINQRPLSSFHELPFPLQAPTCRAAAGRVAPRFVPGAESWALLGDARRKDKHHHIGIIGIDKAEERQIAATAKARGQEGALVGRRLGAALSRQVHDAGGVIIFNHPAWRESERGLEYDLTRDEAAAVDGVELINDLSHSGYSSAQVLEWVDRTFYRRGFFPALVSGLDEHGPGRDPRPATTVVLTPDGVKDEGALISGIRRGATYVTQVEGLGLGLAFGLSLPSQRIAELNVEAAGVPNDAEIQVVYNGRVIDTFSPIEGVVHATLGVPIEPADAGRPGYFYLKVLAKAGPSGSRALLAATSAQTFTIAHE